MPDHLLIRPEDSAARQWRWRAVDAAGEGGHGTGPLAEALPLAPGRRILLLIPGEAVLLTTAHVPVRSRAKAMTAVPWALEDRLVADVERLHFALGRQDAQGGWPVAAIDHEILGRWLAACRESGLAPHVAVPEPLMLAPPVEGRWSVLEEPGRVVCRTGDVSGFACASALLASVTEALDPPAVVERVAVEDADAAWPDRFGPVMQPATSVTDPLQAFEPPAGAPALDLLQGPYSRRERVGRLWRRWRLPAGLAAALAVLLLANQVLVYRDLTRREAALQAAIEEVLRNAAPDIDRVVNPRVQLRNRLDAARAARADGGAGMLAALGRAGPVLAGTDGLELIGLEWRNDTLDLTVETPELAALDRLQRSLRERGFEAELRGVEQGEEQVRGEVRVTRERT